MMHNTISVVIATYNGEKHITRQLNSIVKQTTKPDEIVICDDKSIDRTVDIVRSFAKQYSFISWKIIVNDHNLGYKKNFAKAILNASCDIIFLSDQDDCWFPQKIEKMMNSFYNNSDIKVLASKYIKINYYDLPNNEPQREISKKAINSIYIKKHLKRIRFKKSFYMTHFPGCSLAIKKECKEWFKDSHWNGDEPHDEYLLIVGQLEESAFFLDDTLFYYIRHQNATTYGKMKNRLERINHLENKYKSLLIARDYSKCKIITSSKDKKERIINKEIHFLKKRINFLKKPSLVKGLALLLCFYKYERLSYFLGDLYFSIK